MTHFNRLFSKINNNLSLLMEDPNIFLRKIKSFVLKPRSGLIGIGKNIKFYIDLELKHPAITGMYFGIYEYQLINALRIFLKKGDTFIDVGANIGYISAHALSLIGKEGSIHAFEPVPKYFEYLKNLKNNNEEYSIKLNNVALGADKSISKIAVNNSNFGWNTMVPDFMSSGIKEEIQVPIILLGDYIANLDQKEQESIRLIKIDVEGYEFEVLKGLRSFLEHSVNLPAIIVEINTSAYCKLGYTASDVQDFMESFNYSCKSLNFRQDINLAELTATTDVCFIAQKI